MQKGVDWTDFNDLYVSRSCLLGVAMIAHALKLLVALKSLPDLHFVRQLTAISLSGGQD